MDQNKPNDTGSGLNTGSTASGTTFGTGGTGSGMNTGGGMSTGSGNTDLGGTGAGLGGGTGAGSFGSGSGLGSTGTGSTGGFGVTSASDTGSGAGTEHCPHCGQSMNKGGGLEQFLGRLGITEDMVGNLKSQFQNVDIDEYLNTARDYLKDSSGKAGTYAKENPGKVAAGVAALALGAGLIYAAVNRDKDS